MVNMRSDGTELDVESILECPEKEECEILRLLAKSCHEFQSRVDGTIETYLALEKDHLQRCEADTELLTQLHTDKKDVAIKLDNVVLAQKVQGKKLVIAIKQQAKLKKELDEAKIKKESISLEMVDLDQEIKDAKRQKKGLWSSIKQACSIYKENLNFYIEYTPHEDHETVKVTFFIHQNPDKNNYYVNLLNYENSWKVSHIEPAIKETHLEELKATIDITKSLDDQDIIFFLCNLRNVFSKHYFKRQYPQKYRLSPKMISFVADSTKSDLH